MVHVHCCLLWCMHRSSERSPDFKTGVVPEILYNATQVIENQSTTLRAFEATSTTNNGLQGKSHRNITISTTIPTGHTHTQFSKVSVFHFILHLLRLWQTRVNICRRLLSWVSIFPTWSINADCKSRSPNEAGSLLTAASTACHMTRLNTHRAIVQCLQRRGGGSRLKALWIYIYIYGHGVTGSNAASTPHMNLLRWRVPQTHPEFPWEGIALPREFCCGALTLKLSQRTAYAICYHMRAYAGEPMGISGAIRN